MAEVNEQVAVFATGSKYEQVSNSLGEIGAGLRDMDFDRVTQGAKLFQKTAASITFKDAIGSVKQLGSAFVSIGKTILTNPLFLIVGVVTAIIAGIVALLDKLGILKKVFEFVGKAIDAVVQSIKDFLDWIGLTSFAAEDAARRQVAAQEKIAKAYEDKQERVTDAYDQEIRLANIAGKDTTELELEKQRAIIETSRLQYEALQNQMNALRASGDLTKEKADEIRKAMIDLKKNIREARQEIQAVNAQEVADTKKAADDKARIQAEAAKKAREARAAEKARLEKERLEALAAEKKFLEEMQQLTIESLEADAKARADYDKKVQDDQLAAQISMAEMFASEEQKEFEKREKLADEDLEREKKYIEAKQNLNATLISGLSGLASFLEQQGIKTAGLQKTIALVQLATDTAKSISAVIAGATAAASAAGPAAPFVLAGYIASGIGLVLGAVGQAQAILKAAPPMGGSVGGGSPMSASTMSAAPSAQPNVSLFGSNNSMNNVSAPQSNEVIQVQAVVSETEMTATQNKIAKIQMANSM